MADAAPRHDWTAALAVYLKRHALAMLGLGFATGLPFFLVFDTLSAWLRADGLSLETIAFFSLTTLAYAFKFLWAPWVDQTPIPFLTVRLGYRRSWMIVVQIAIIVGLAMIAGSRPAENLAAVALFAVLTGFASATQDIVVDAWRIEVAGESEQGAMAAAHAWGYRVALVIAGAIPLLLADAFNWAVSYGVMAALMIVGIAAALLAPRERAQPTREITRSGHATTAPEYAEWVVRLLGVVGGALVLGSGLTGNFELLKIVLSPTEKIGPAGQLIAVIVGFGAIVAAASPIPGLPTAPGAYLAQAFGAPLSDFFTRFRGQAMLILALICLYRISDFVLNLMNPFYIDLGFTLTEIAEVRKIFGVVMSMLGVFLGGVAIARYGLMGPLVVGALAGPISNLVFAWLAIQGPEVSALFVAIGIDNVAGGFSGTCLIAYMSSLTSAGFTASQYALFTSLYALPGKFIAAASGRIVTAAAVSAESGGLFAPLTSLFDRLPVGSLAEGAKLAGVSAVSLGAGYVVFFVYTAVIGVVAVVLTVMIAARRLRRG
ncbi:MAG: AmpG family muropeptide MFS transporter [Alphaproteobacteria bacterium]|nr:AmpG family muropeptide MFS transporter [Alphaproteobacteria bacterium]